MVLRWYTVVIDCNDVRKQAAWWAEAFGWQTIIETDDECVNVPGWVTPDSIRDLPWERIGPGMTPLTRRFGRCSHSSASSRASAPTAAFVTA